MDDQNQYRLHFSYEFIFSYDFMDVETLYPSMGNVSGQFNV